MRVLLDTDVLIWVLIEPDRVAPEVRDTLQDPGNEILFSAVSIWEIAIKFGLGRADFGVSPDQLFETARATGFVERPVTSVAALKVATLPHHHRDPFDRLLVAQALTEPAILYTVDARLRAYSDLVVDVR